MKPGCDGTFVSLGRNEVDRAKYDPEHYQHKQKRGSGEWGEFVNSVGYIGDDRMIEMVPPEQDI